MIYKKKRNDKSIRKLGGIWLLSLLMVISSFLSIISIKAAGTNVTLGHKINYSYSVTNSKGQTVWANDTELIYADGDIAFCVQPGILLNPGSSYTKSEYSFAQRKTIEHIAYVGWELSNKTDEDYLATTFMIWETLGARINSTSFTGYDAKKVAIQNEINAMFNAKPSFNDKNITLNIGQSITLTDTNNVFSYYNLSSKSNGINVSKNGNNLTITATASAPDNASVSYQLVKKDSVGTSMLYSSTNSQDVVSAKVQDPNNININIKVNKYGKLNITKQDEDGTIVPNTTFKLSKNSDMSSPVGTYTTGGNGSVLVNDLLPGTYYVQETVVPSHLVLDSTVHTVTIKPNETTSYVARNNWVKGKVLIRKTDTESGKQVAGATYAIFNNQNQELQRLVTTATGYAESGYLRFGSYYVKEVIAPDGYVLNDTQYPVTIATNEQKIDVTGNDVRVKGSINITKEDSITGNKPQGQDTSLAGAVYELKARNPILDPADKSIIYAKDTVVTTLTTDEQAKASVNELYLGDYYLLETKPSPGYTLDKTEYDISIKYDGQNIPVITKNQTVKERVIAQAFSLIKVSDNGTGETDLLKGVEFTVKAKPDVDKAGSWDKAPIAKNAQGKDAAILITDEKGYAVSDELPIGTYIVRETKAPDDHYKVPDFTVTVTQDSRDPQPWRVLNDGKFKAVVAIVKKDAETGKIVALPGAEFKIRNTDTDEYVGFWKWNPLPHYVDSWMTDESGTVMTDDVLLPGNYSLEEVKAPEGYTLNTKPIPFKISSNGIFETLPDGKTPVITVVQKDTSVKGRITASKEGEVLTSTSKDDKGNTIFHYTKQKLANAVFEIYARENIMSADNQGDILYKKGDLVQTLTTSADGTATTKDLPLGKYQVKEKTAPDGFTHSAEVKNVDLTFKDENTAVVFNNTSYLNDRQKVSIKLVKKDADTQTPLQGAIFGLSADADIYTQDHKLLIKKGTLIETSISDEKGNVSFKADLPLNKYVVKELTPPVGYISSDVVLNIDASYQGQDVKTIAYTKDVLNNITKTEISKVDITDNSEIEGASLVVYPKGQPGAIADSWISGQDGKDDKDNILPHMIKGLEPGKTYILHEVSSPYGFSLAKDIEFTVKDTGDIQKVTMQDKPVEGQLKWNKSGEIFNQVVTGQNEFGKTESPVWNKSNILGAEITIYAAQDIKIGNKTYYKENEKVQTLESDWDAVLSKKLPVGKYYYRETKTPMGYITNTDKHYFEVKDNQVNDLQTIESTLDNPRPSFDIDMTKVMEQQDIFKNPDAYKDVVFGIYSREDIYDYMGNVAIKNGTMISTSGIDEKGHLINVPDLPNGLYYIKELTTNNRYILDKNEYDFEIAYQGADTAKYTIKIGKDGMIINKLKRSYIKVNKVDYYDHKDILKAAEFTLYADAACTKPIKTVSTDAKNGIALFDNLAYATYFIKETKAPAGYQLSKEVIKVTIDDNWVHGDDKLRTIVFPDKPLPGGLVSINKINTGDHTNILVIIFISIVSGCALIILLWKYKKDKNTI